MAYRLEADLMNLQQQIVEHFHRRGSQWLWRGGV